MAYLIDWIWLHWWGCLYLFSFHVLTYCIYTSPDLCACAAQSPASGWGRTPTAHPAPLRVSTSRQRSHMCKTEPQRAMLCWKGMTQRVNASSGKLFSLVACSYAHLLLSKKPSLVPLWQLAAGLGGLLDTPGCGAAPQAQSSRNTGYGIAWNLQGDRCNTIPGNLISANSKAKKWSYLITPVLGRAWCVLHVISVSVFTNWSSFAFKHWSLNREKHLVRRKKVNVSTILKLISLLNCTCNCWDTDSHSDISCGIISPCFRSSSSSFENIKKKKKKECKLQFKT